MKRIFIFFLLLINGAVFSQNDPIWMQLERGKNYFAKRDYGNAMICFRKCLAVENMTATSLPDRLTKDDVADLRKKIVYDTDLAFFDTTIIEDESFYRIKTDLSEFDRIRLANLLQEYQYQPKNPEAYEMMARILEIEGEFALAEKYYQTALDQAKAFGADTSIYEISYYLIGLYIKTGNQDGLNRAFDDLNSRNGFLNSDKGKSFMEDVYSSFKKNGLDKTMELYRHTGDSFLKAYRLAGDRYAETEDYESAVRYYLLHVVASLSVLMEEMPNVAYASSGMTVEQVLAEALRNDYMLRFMDSVDLFGTFLALGDALYDSGDWQNAQNFFWLTARYSPEIEYKEKASDKWNKIASEKIG
ncbi:MAG: hypothetical protein SOZ27_06680 [Spirochaetia bacterium]|nr:hypothetical protein [Spirochaetia bacterium]